MKIQRIFYLFFGSDAEEDLKETCELCEADVAYAKLLLITVEFLNGAYFSSLV